MNHLPACTFDVHRRDDMFCLGRNILDDNNICLGFIHRSEVGQLLLLAYHTAFKSGEGGGLFSQFVEEGVRERLVARRQRCLARRRRYHCLSDISPSVTGISRRSCWDGG